MATGSCFFVSEWFSFFLPRGRDKFQDYKVNEVHIHNANVTHISNFFQIFLLRMIMNAMIFSPAILSEIKKKSDSSELE